MDKDRCCIKGCKGDAALSYCGRPLCDRHWDKLAEKSPDEIRVAVGLKALKALTVALPQPDQPVSQ